MRKHRTLALRALLFVAAGIFVIPMYLLFAISMKTQAEVASSPFAPPLSPHFQNYADAWNSSSGSGTASFGQAVINSLVITTLSVVIVIAVGALTGYVLGRRTSRLSTWTFAAFLAGIAIPAQMIVLPFYWALARLELTGTIAGMVMLYVGILIPFTVFLYTGFVRALPRDFEEASRIDGASELRTFFFVVFPLLRPVTVTVAILSSIGVWNDFFGQLVFLNASGKETLPVTVYSWATQYATNYPVVTAGLVIALLPMLAFYLLLQRGIIAGFSTGLRG
jgi:raffinose/stachyose/melibiose transport system permease protein